MSESSRVENVSVSPEGNTLDFLADGLELWGVRTALIGAYQIKNAALALSALSLVRSELAGITPHTIREGMLKASWPGRLEVRGNIILDGGHNFDGVANLCRSIKELWPGKNVGVVYAAMRDKDYSGCLELLSSQLRPKLYVTTVPDMQRAAKPEELLAASQNFSWLNEPEGFALPEEAIKRACSDENDIVIVCGSLYLVGYVRSRTIK